MLVVVERRPVRATANRSGGKTISAVWTVEGHHELTLVADMSHSHYGKLKLANKINTIDPLMVIRGHASVILIAMDILEQMRRRPDTRIGALTAEKVWQVMLWCYMDSMDRKEAWHAFHKNGGSWWPRFLEVTAEGVEGRQQYDKLVDWEPARDRILAELRERKAGWE